MAGLTIDNPVTLAQALASQRVIPGDTLLLLPGVYTADNGKGKFSVQCHGTVAAPITIRPQIPGTVRINGGIEMLGSGVSSYITLQDLEIGPTPTGRSFANYASVDYPNAVYCTAPGCKIIGNVIRDGSEGLSLFGAGATLVAENIFMGNGFVNPDGGHGTNIYTHNHQGGTIDILHNLFDRPYGAHSVNHWSASINTVQDYYTRENSITGGVLFVGCESGITQNNRLHDNHIALNGIRLGRPNALNGTVEVLRNRVRSMGAALMLYGQNAATITNNVFAKDSAGSELVFWQIGADEANVIDENSYYAISGQAIIYSTSHQGVLQFSAWQGLGYDVNSTATIGAPASNEIFVYPFEYSARWLGLVIVWNWEGAESVAVPLTTLDLDAGASYRWRQQQDVENDTDTFEYTGASVTFDMRAVSHSVAIPTADNYPRSNTTFPVYGAFVLEAI